MTSSFADRWLLPDGIEELLPPAAQQLENLRRRLLDGFAAAGYEQVFPPLVEYLESLLTGTGHDLDLQTFKLTDQLTGRLMGVRADITPQTARIDAHSLGREGVTRLCYAGTVLRTRAEFGESRAPIQLGAELYGHVGVDGDIEIVALMIDAVNTAGAFDLLLDLGHVGICRALVQAAALNREQCDTLFDIYRRKALPELETFVASEVKDAALASALAALPRLAGDLSVLALARQQLSALALPAVDAAIADLQRVAEALTQLHPGLQIFVDLGELRGYHYHTGLVFAAYAAAGCGTHGGDALAKGGRYDHVGEVFGRARPATGFSMDLKTLLRFALNETPAALIYAPAGQDAVLVTAIRRLRAEGQRVVQALPGEKMEASSSHLVLIDGEWKVAHN